MNNLSINFNSKIYFRIFDNVRIYLKKILTKLKLRDTQSCKYCGRDQHIIWSVKDNIWNILPKKWKNKCLCLECFSLLCP